MANLPAGTELYRLHQTRFAATSFNPTPSHRYFDGGRFDSTEDDLYGYIYVGDSPEGAVAETLLRDRPISDTGAITISRSQVDGRRLSRLVVARDLSVVDLRSLQSLRAASQDTWLTMAEPADYAQTRHWGHWIRARAPQAAGFAWLSKRDASKTSYVLFADRCPPRPLLADAGWRPSGVDPDFDRPSGHNYLVDLLAPYFADVSPSLP